MLKVRLPSIRPTRLVLIAALTLALPLSALTGATPSESSREPLRIATQTASGKLRVETVAPGTVRYSLTDADGVTRELTDIGDEADVLVQLSEAPLATAVEALRPRTRTIRARDAQGSRGPLSPQILTLRKSIDDQHRRVRDALSSIQARMSSQGGTARRRSATIKHEYHRAFNGFALRASNEVIEELRRHPDVVAVHRNVKRTANLSESVPLVGAPEAWAQGLTGSGVVVAIVDSGIDYSHSDLGGCLGPACRVIGGYDFVNQDEDPMDDYGHGTHVAGIVAANGALKGMAPDAQLMGFKVLDQWGEGWDSEIIAAIERACDPDGDPLTDDAVDVINMSLGGPGDPDDALSQAIDNAAQAGVVSVVAAGNERGYGTVSSPGSARRAITVGATDKSDVLTWYSSKGPAASTDAIKPDLVAPGEDINSTLPGGSYERYGGTSMASPHVAGAAALLRQRDPAVSPDVIKSLLMTSARDLGEDAFAQGSGRLDIVAALEARTIVTPASLSLGYNDPSQATFDRSLAVTITNSSDVTKEYALSVAPGLPAGIAAAVAPTSLALDPGQSGAFTFSLYVDNSVVPNVDEAPFSYQSHVRVESGSETIRIPFAFVKTPTLTLTFDEGPEFVYISDGGGRPRRYPYPGRSLKARLPSGKYDVLAHFAVRRPPLRMWTVVREAVVVSGATTLPISRNEAVHALTVDPRDENGDALAPKSIECVFPFGNNASLSIAIWGATTPIGWQMSPMSERYPLSCLVDTTSQPAISTDPQSIRKTYTLQWFNKGLDGPWTLRNDPESLRPLSFRVDVEPGTETIDVFNSNTHRTGSMKGFVWRLKSPFVMQRFVLPVPDPEAFYTYFEEIVRRSKNFGEPDDVLYRTPRLQVTPETVRFFLEPKTDSQSPIDWDPSVPVHETKATEFVIGMEPYSWFGRFVNDPAEIRIGSAFGGMTWPFVGQMMDSRLQRQVPFELYQDAALVQRGILEDREWPIDGQPLLLGVTPGRYTLRLHGPTDSIGDKPGSVVVDATFDTSAADPNPPYLSHFNLLVDGAPAKTLDLSHRSEIRFRAYDDTQLSHVALQFRAWTDGPWLPLFLRRKGNEYSARLPYLPFLVGQDGQSKQRPVSLKLVARDRAGNVISLTMQPAFTLSLPALPGMPSPIASNP